jgi:hypothetical protein
MQLYIYLVSAHTVCPANDASDGSRATLSVTQVYGKRAHVVASWLSSR